MSTLDKYMEEIVQDTNVDNFNILDVQMRLPAIKHKWVGRLMRHKFEVKELRKQKEKLIRELTNKLVSESPVKIAEPVAEKKVSKVDSVLKIDAEIKEAYLLIEYLEKVEKIFSSMTFDIKNVTEIMKLETT
jgi:hypothetical protein|tara:strand:- start:740 stop:1135 length:396 start_codon:yes stop_codon:yes gene_type:complete